MCLKELAEHAASEEMASRAYRALANWCDINDWVGCASFFRGESLEEMKHAMAFEEYAIDRGQAVDVPVQSAMPTNPGASLLASFSAALELEKKVFDELSGLSQLAVDSKDYDAVRFLQAYLEIGTKSIKDLQVQVSWLARADGDQAALQAFDRDLGDAE